MSSYKWTYDKIVSVHRSVVFDFCADDIDENVDRADAVYAACKVDSLTESSSSSDTGSSSTSAGVEAMLEEQEDRQFIWVARGEGHPSSAGVALFSVLADSVQGT